MTTMPAGEFKAQCLRVLDEVQRGRSPVVITKRGKPVAKLVPIETPPEDIFDRLKGSITIEGDLLAPVLATKDWEVLR